MHARVCMMKLDDRWRFFKDGEPSVKPKITIYAKASLEIHNGRYTNRIYYDTDVYFKATDSKDLRIIKITHKYFFNDEQEQ